MMKASVVPPELKKYNVKSHNQETPQRVNPACLALQASATRGLTYKPAEGKGIH